MKRVFALLKTVFPPLKSLYSPLIFFSVCVQNSVQEALGRHLHFLKGAGLFIELRNCHQLPDNKLCWVTIHIIIIEECVPTATYHTLIYRIQLAAQIVQFFESAHSTADLIFKFIGKELIVQELLTPQMKLIRRECKQIGTGSLT